MPRRHTPYPRHRASAAGTTAGGSSSPTQPKSVDAFSTSTHPSVSMGATASAHGLLLAPFLFPRVFVLRRHILLRLHPSRPR
jgi:hypothetical protein